MPKLRITRFLQHPAECAVASASSVAHYYNKKIDYEQTRIIAEDMISSEVTDGLYDGEIGLLFNLLGFKSVEIVSADLDCFDYTWNKLSHKKLIEELKHMGRLNADCRENCKSMAKFLNFDGYKNKLIIDYSFARYIKEYLTMRIPVIISFDWTMFLRMPKLNDKGVEDAMKGISEAHAVVARGFDDKGVYIVDSHNEYYKYKRKRYRTGKYRIEWDDLMVIMGSSGTIIAPQNYDKSLLKYELAS